MNELVNSQLCNSTTKLTNVKEGLNNMIGVKCI